MSARPKSRSSEPQIQNPDLATHNSELETQNSELAPPFWKSWRRLYGLVLVELAVLIVLFYALTKAFE
jgi:hypothetical protein